MRALFFILAFLPLAALAEEAPPHVIAPLPSSTEPVQKPDASAPPPISATELAHSPFFSTEEMETISTALDRKEQTARKEKKLDAILYFDKTHWKVWYGGDSFTPETRRRDIEILAVTPQSVRLALERGGEPRVVTLHLNESAEGPVRKGPANERPVRPASAR